MAVCLVGVCSSGRWSQTSTVLTRLARTTATQTSSLRESVSTTMRLQVSARPPSLSFYSSLPSAVFFHCNFCIHFDFLVHLTSFHLSWVRYEATHLAVAATSQNEVVNIVLIGCSHSELGRFTALGWNEVRWDGTRWTLYKAVTWNWETFRGPALMALITHRIRIYSRATSDDGTAPGFIHVTLESLLNISRIRIVRKFAAVWFPSSCSFTWF